MKNEDINRLAASFVNMAKDECHINEIEFLGYHITPKQYNNDSELLFKKSVNLLNFYEGEIKEESPLTYNLILTQIANIIKNE